MIKAKESWQRRTTKLHFVWSLTKESIFFEMLRTSVYPTNSRWPRAKLQDRQEVSGDEPRRVRGFHELNHSKTICAWALQGVHRTASVPVSGHISCPDAWLAEWKLSQVSGAVSQDLHWPSLFFRIRSSQILVVRPFPSRNGCATFISTYLSAIS